MSQCLYTLIFKDVSYMKAKNWLIIWTVLTGILLFCMGKSVFETDPYFHYRKPDLSKYYYELDNQRSQNDGILRNFEYDAIITGSSMTENFKTSEMDELFGTNSVKVPFQGASFKEVNDNLRVAFNNNSSIKTVVRGLDLSLFLQDKDTMRYELDMYPTYLYDDNIFNDVKYLFNKEVIFDRVYKMRQKKGEQGFKPGITSFDEYSCWQKDASFGKNEVLREGLEYCDSDAQVHLSEEEKKVIYENVVQNITSLPGEYTDVDFYYFFTPYSAAWWASQNVCRQVEAEKIVIELLLQYPNIHLYSFNNRTDITTDLNNYMDTSHYGQWFNSLILKWMKDGHYLLTEDNYLEYLDDELCFYTSFNYECLNEQVDFENDFYTDAFFEKKLEGIEPVSLLGNSKIDVSISSAELVENQYQGEEGIKCTGRLDRISDNDPDLGEYLLNKEYIGAKIYVEDIGEHDYLICYGKKLKEHGQPGIFVYDEQGRVIGSTTANCYDLNNEWYMYSVDLKDYDGEITVILNGGYIDTEGSPDSEYMFSGVMLY